MTGRDESCQFRGGSESIPGDPTKVEITVGSANRMALLSICQRGFWLRCHVGVNLETVLVHDLGLSPELVKEKVGTIFLDGKPVDNPENAPVRNGCTVALSSAMPGLAGAVLRRGSCLAVFRESISCKEEFRGGESLEGFIRIKLFNQLTEEMGPNLLRRGFFLSLEELKTWLELIAQQKQGDSIHVRIAGTSSSIGDANLDLLQGWVQVHLHLSA